uniref:Variant surface glycoprotein 1125.5433 n=1 Tax=Trypanosoma brucei TaxID=5691 RepID=A0A1J0RCK9_9TRYP|nr:variant surface glycoprotein 1125.5433 [Trypanosoma brucei]
MQHAAWKPACELVADLRHISSIGFTSLTNKDATAKSAKTASLIAQLYGVSNKDKSQEYEATALSIALSRYEQQGRTSFMTAVKTAIEATKSAKNLAGAIVGTIDVFAVTKHDSVYCLGNANGAGDDTAAKATYGCSYNLNALTSSATLLADNNINDRGYAKLTDDTTGNSITSTTPTKCILAEHGSANTDFSNSGGSYNKLIGGLFDLTTTQKFKRGGYAAVKARTDRKTDEPQTTAFHDFQALKQSFMAAPTTEEAALITNIVSNGMLKTAIAEQLALRKYEKKTSTHENEAEQIIKTKYKLEGNTIK